MNVPTRLHRPIFRCLQCLNRRPPLPIKPRSNLRQPRWRLLSSSSPSARPSPTPSPPPPPPPPPPPAAAAATPRPDAITQHRLDAQQRAHHQRRMYYAATGMAACMLAIWILATSIDIAPEKTEGPAGPPPPSGPASAPTGHPAVPSMPRTIRIADTDYTLLGLCVRT
ncbi:hypothetical protein FGG08_005465, partial [Glutinoglossum americanum]